MWRYVEWLIRMHMGREIERWEWMTVGRKDMWRCREKGLLTRQTDRWMDIVRGCQIRRRSIRFDVSGFR